MTPRNQRFWRLRAAWWFWRLSPCAWHQVWWLAGSLQRALTVQRGAALPAPRAAVADELSTWTGD